MLVTNIYSSPEHKELKVKIEPKSEVIETDDKLLEFSFFEADDVNNQEQKGINAEQDDDDVIDRIFAAAKGGNQKDLSKLIFSSKTKEKDSSREENKKNKGVSFPLKRKSPSEGWTHFSSKKALKGVEEKVANFKDIQNTFQSFTRVADENGRFVQVELRKSPPILKDSELPSISTSVPKTAPSNVNKHSIIKATAKPTVSKGKDNLSKNTDPTKDSNSANAQTNKKTPLIDIGVLTKAITNVLEECISKNEKSNIKLVLFCNDKPRHSFSILETLMPGAEIKKTEEGLNTKDKEIVEGLCEPSAKGQGKGEGGSAVSPSTNQALNRTSNLPNLTEIHSYAEDSIRIIGNTKSSVKAFKEAELPNVLIKRDKNQENECSLAQTGSGPKICETSGIVNSEKVLVESKTGKNQDLKANSKPSTNKKDRISNGICDEELQPDKEETQINVEDELEEGKLEIVENTDIKSEENNNSGQPEGKIHVGFQCTACLKVFKTQRYLKIHRNNVHRLYDEIKEKEYPQNNTVPSLDEFLEERFGGAQTETDNTEKDKVDITEIDDTVSEAEKEFINLLLKRDPLTAHDISSDFNDSPQYFRRSKIISLQNLANRESQGEQFEIEPVFVCEHCGKFYHSRKSIKEHFIREHSTEPGQEPLYIFIETNSFNCPICFKPFPNPYNLVAHAKTHTRDEELKCAVCGKIYSSVYVLRRHIDTIHSDIRPRPFKCRFCDYAAENRWHLREHQRRHTGEQPFQCPICLKNFSHQGTMNRHCKVTHKVIPGAPKRLFYPGANPDSELSHVSLPDKKLTKEAEPAQTVLKLSNAGNSTKVDLSLIPIGSVETSNNTDEIVKLLKAPNKGISAAASCTETSTEGEDIVEQRNNTETELGDSDPAFNESNISSTALGPEGELVIIKQEPLDD